MKVNYAFGKLEMIIVYGVGWAFEEIYHVPIIIVIEFLRYVVYASH